MLDRYVGYRSDTYELWRDRHSNLMNGRYEKASVSEVLFASKVIGIVARRNKLSVSHHIILLL